MFFQKLRKCADYDVKANAELENSNTHIFEYRDTKDNFHVFNFSDLSKCCMIIQFKEKLTLQVD